MIFQNPFKIDLSAKCKCKKCSFAYQIQGAFWTMVAFMFMTFIFKIFGFLILYHDAIYNIKTYCSY